jgi:hypothetical protein
VTEEAKKSGRPLRHPKMQATVRSLVWKKAQTKAGVSTADEEFFGQVISAVAAKHPDINNEERFIQNTIRKYIKLARKDFGTGTAAK